MALIDKFRPVTDGRGIDVRLTAKGHRLQRDVHRIVHTTEFAYRERGYAYGLRWYLEVCDDKEFPED